MKNENYKIITKEELERHIKENNLSPNYYSLCSENDVDSDGDLLFYIKEWLSGMPIYFDAGAMSADEQIEFTKMIKNARYKDIIILESLYDIYPLNILEMLVYCNA